MKFFTLLLAALGCLNLLHAQDDERRDSNRRFEGTIGEDLKVTLLLETTMGENATPSYGGAYHYHKTGIPIRLGQISGTGETIRFRENESQDSQGRETFTGEWAIRLQEDAISGTWSSRDGKKKLPIKLQESYPAGSVPALTTSLEAVQTVGRNGQKRGFDIKVRYVQLLSKSPEIKAVNQMLRQDAWNVPVNTEEEPPAPPQNPSEKDILANMLAIPESQEEGDWEGAYVESVDDSQRVLMNENGFLTIEYLTWTYSGGAHGNYTQSYRCFDLKTGKEVYLEDLVRANFEKRWAALGATELRVQQGLKPDAPLTEAGLFEDQLELNETWFLTPGGIGFSYDPYEIGPYARGSIQFVLPWKDILADLEPGTRVFEIASRLATKGKK